MSPESQNTVWEARSHVGGVYIGAIGPASDGYFIGMTLQINGLW